MQVGSLLALNTAVGWTISGRANKKTPAPSNTCLSTLTKAPDPPWHQELIESVQRFWELEDVPPFERKSKLHEDRENLFADHRRDANGKYTVRLPLMADAASKLGNSETSARASLASLHRRMKRDASFAAEYRKFMDDYLRLGHMRVISEDETRCIDRVVHYIPHHGIWQRTDEGNRLRVVFDASRPTSSGKSLNDILHRGPKLQTDVWIVQLRWRTHRHAFCTDIRMMFRQIWIDERDIDLQRILWSPSEEEPVRHLQLLTVTYGTSCAPYLSLRTLQQLCADEGQRFPRAMEAALKDRYVDDILSGAHDLKDALLLRDQLIELMKVGGFPLRKWVANGPELLEGLDLNERLRSTWIKFSDENPVRELGIVWNPREDTLGLGRPHPLPTEISKRRILSVLASIFDPCGWLAPATLLTKLLLQDLWRASLDWDEELLTSMSQRWHAIYDVLSAFTEVSLPRWISTIPAADNISLHAFADASRRAMAAVVYSRTTTTSDYNSVNLLVAKTKLSPIRSLRPTSKPAPRMTIPRLELRAALIAARLLRRICDELKIPLNLSFAWSDSQIVLHWIHSEEPTGNAIVDGYVHQIQELSPTSIWRYVPSEQNPADVASRGADVKQLLREGHWFSGPNWLAGPRSHWPLDQRVAPPFDVQHEGRTTLTCTREQEGADHLSRFSNLAQLLRFLTRLRRWIRQKLNRQPAPTVLAPMTVNELRTSWEACVRLSQSRSFSHEIALLERMQKDGKMQSLPGRTPVKTLSPFVCPKGILRVGGRLAHSKLPYDVKHPPLLDGASALAGLVTAWAHDRSLHGGFRSTYSYALQRAWIIGGKRKIRQLISHCVVCNRSRASPMS